MNKRTFSFRQLFALFFIACISLLAASLLQAWTGPTGTAPANNVAAPINVGTTDQVKNAGISVTGLSVYGSQYIQDKLGIGTTAIPVVALDVNGVIRITRGDNTDGTQLLCQSVTAGVIRYNTTSNTLEYCNGTTWGPVGGGGASSGSYQVFTSSGTWTKPSDLTGNEMVMVEMWAGGGGGGGGSGNTSTNTAIGGGGGGGGACTTHYFRASDLGATASITIGAGGSLGPGTSTHGSNGGAGGNTLFVSTAASGASVSATIYGGGGGGGGDNSFSSVTSGGTGGGALSSGGDPVNIAGSFPGRGYSSYDAGGIGAPGSSGGTSDLGGGGGGLVQVGAEGGALSAGKSFCGGGGGGGGGDANREVPLTSAGGVGATSEQGGGGGTGGGGNLSSTGGPGTSGLAPGGGGGGGGGANHSHSGGAGGTGARGEVRVWVLK